MAHECKISKVIPDGANNCHCAANAACAPQLRDRTRRAAAGAAAGDGSLTGQSAADADDVAAVDSAAANEGAVAAGTDNVVRDSDNVG